MSEEAYAIWAMDRKGVEWVDGEVVFKMASDEEQDGIQRLIAAVIETMVKRRKLGAVRGPNFTSRMTLAEKRVRRDPDVMFIPNDSLSRAHATYLEGPADLVVEVVSPESEFRDFNEKYGEYEEAGVKEYWIVNPLSQQIHLFVRNAASRFERRDADPAGRFQSAVIAGLWFHPDDLFKDRPDVVTMLRKIDPSLLA